MENFDFVFNLVAVTARCKVIGTIKVSNVHLTLPAWRTHTEDGTCTLAAGLFADEDVRTCRICLKIIIREIWRWSGRKRERERERERERDMYLSCLHDICDFHGDNRVL